MNNSYKKEKSMDDFLGRVKTVFDKTTNIISIRSTTIVEITKLKNERATLKRQKKKIFTQVGEGVYNMKKEGSINLTIVEDMVSEAEVIDEKINQLNIQIDEALKKQEEQLRKEEQERAKATEATYTKATYRTAHEDVESDIYETNEVVDVEIVVEETDAVDSESVIEEVDGVDSKDGADEK
jgi:hypothetical protein